MYPYSISHWGKNIQNITHSRRPFGQRLCVILQLFDSYLGIDDANGGKCVNGRGVAMQQLPLCSSNAPCSPSDTIALVTPWSAKICAFAMASSRMSSLLY